MTFRLNLEDISRILTSIQVAERHVQSGYLEQTDLMGNPLNNLVPLGLRTVSGEYNNLIHQGYGSADQFMPRLLMPTFQDAEINPRTGQSTSYAQTAGSVYDSQPRTISNLISDQSANNPAVLVAALLHWAQQIPTLMQPPTLLHARQRRMQPLHCRQCRMR